MLLARTNIYAPSSSEESISLNLSQNRPRNAFRSDAINTIYKSKNTSLFLKQQFLNITFRYQNHHDESSSSHASISMHYHNPSRFRDTNLACFYNNCLFHDRYLPGFR